MQGQAVEKWEDVFKQGNNEADKLVKSHER
jgi:hypothetical protein